MNENQNVKVGENSQEIEQVVSSVISRIICNTVASTQCSATPSSFNPNITNIIDTKAHEPTNEERPRAQIPPQRSPRSKEVLSTYEIYRSLGQFSESQSDIDIGACTRNVNKDVLPTAPCVPPSYSTVIKQGRPSLDIRRDARSMETQHLSPFSRIPPPSYAEINGTWSREFSNASSEQILLGPDPIYIWCTHCATVVITVTQSQRSKFTHITAAALCLFGCWPCAMLPYCMNSCKNIYHYCPDCNYLFGMYRPW